MRFSPVLVAIATGLGVGYVRVAPGTFGSLLGLLAWSLLPSSPALQAVVIIAVFGVGVWSAAEAERSLQSSDPAPVVIDEVLGMLITLFMNPVGWAGAVAGFVLFRVFDVVKPYPANRLDEWHGGMGVMADDAMAGIYANLALRLGLMATAAFGQIGA